MNYREQVRSGELYVRLNEILQDRLPKIKTALSKALKAFLEDKNFTNPLIPVKFSFVHGSRIFSNYNPTIDRPS